MTDVVQTSNGMSELIRLLHQRYADLGDTVARKAAWTLNDLRVALIRYGNHTDECASANVTGPDLFNDKCTCGLQQILHPHTPETPDALEPTREHLQKLVQRTAGHWLSLSLTHPIPWEGAIDAAMEAACNEIRRLNPNALKAPACPKCDAVRKLGLASCFEHAQSVNGEV